MPPALADYQKAAVALYDPQKQAEANQLKATHDITKNTLEAQKGEVKTNYQSAIDDLLQSVQDQSGQINQLYSQRLGGNFSGLQGNDMGMMFSRANKQQALISTTEANKLNEITAGEANADIAYGTGIANLEPKYHSLEEEASQSNYGSAVKEYNTQKQQDIDNSFKEANLQLGYDRLSSSNANAAASRAQSANDKATSAASKYKVAQYDSGNKKYTGPNGQTNLYDYASNVALGDPDTAYSIIKQELSTGSQTDKGAYNGMLKLEKQGLSPSEIIQRLAKSNPYIFQ